MHNYKYILNIYLFNLFIWYIYLFFKRNWKFIYKIFFLKNYNEKKNYLPRFAWGAAHTASFLVQSL